MTRIFECSAFRVRPLEFEPGLNAPDARFVDEAGQVVEVDAADGRRILGDVTDKGRNIECVGFIANAHAAFEHAFVLEFNRFIQEEVGHLQKPLAFERVI